MAKQLAPALIDEEAPDLSSQDASTAELVRRFRVLRAGRPDLLGSRPEVELLGVGSLAAVRADGGDGVDLVGTELEVEDRDVLLDALGRHDFGITMLPNSICQRSTTWAGVRPCSAAIRVMTRRRGSRPGRAATTPRWRCPRP